MSFSTIFPPLLVFSKASPTTIQELFIIEKNDKIISTKEGEILLFNFYNILKKVCLNMLLFPVV